MDRYTQDQWFENHDQYYLQKAVPNEIEYDKLSLIRVYPNSGKTQPGWGALEFMENYLQNAFSPERAIKFFEKYSSPFGIVMRSVPYVVIDIDGKNGGIPTSRVLNLPETLAERSKSGNGYHLFYRVPGAIWHDLRGYDEFPDIIGLVPGVDIKGTGVVYHYPNQRWNGKPIADLPPRLMELLGRARDIKRASRLTREGARALEPEELLLLHDELKDALAKPVPQGGRNQRLYKIGARMFAADYPHWDTALIERGTQLGLESSEIDELIHNISEYS
ncbi:DNA primase/polymerase [Microbacterium phage AloeVera]|uniref:DNA primase/polymerase n=3 Tax=Akonivirus akoni TaxID=2845587 RepID=A0A6M3T1P1_9CAUD|nr:DNA primase/polymerase [Microbacterium phage Akoni]QCG78289.1 DNA primase/polymerase [Microbacterium phage Akoni]QJD51252.1 DNA primase/polymerase [Microbacterium phage Truong]QJD51742.1 DNA primase/polymerase [Microbacterium phage Ashton]